MAKKDPILDESEAEDETEQEEEASNTEPTKAKPSSAKEAKKSANEPDLSGIDPNDHVAITKARLAAAPKINFIIPLAEGEKRGAYDTVQINGYGLKIQKGVLIPLPEPVAMLLAEKYRITMTAGEEKRVDRSDAVSEALG